MIDCTNDWMRDRLPELLHGRLNAMDRGALEVHLRNCASCAAELALLRRARSAMADVPAVDVAAIVRALPQPPQRTGPTLVVSRSPVAVRRAERATRWRPSAWAPAAAIAATLLLIVGLPIAGRRLADPAGGGSAPAVTVADSGVPQGATTVARSVVSELPADELRALIDELETMEALPALEPDPVLVNVGAEETL